MHATAIAPKIARSHVHARLFIIFSAKLKQVCDILRIFKIANRPVAAIVI